MNTDAWEIRLADLYVGYLSLEGSELPSLEELPRLAVYAEGRAVCPRLQVGVEMGEPPGLSMLAATVQVQVVIQREELAEDEPRPGAVTEAQGLRWMHAVRLRLEDVGAWAGYVQAADAALRSGYRVLRRRIGQPLRDEEDGVITFTLPLALRLAVG